MAVTLDSWWSKAEKGHGRSVYELNSNWNPRGGNPTTSFRSGFRFDMPQSFCGFRSRLLFWAHKSPVKSQEQCLFNTPDSAYLLLCWDCRYENKNNVPWTAWPGSSGEFHPPGRDGKMAWAWVLSLCLRACTRGFWLLFLKWKARII